MERRLDLMPPALDEAKVAHLARLASRIDGASPGHWEDDLDAFNHLAGTALTFENFQGISGAEDHEDYVRRLLYEQAVITRAGLSRAEMVEVVSRVLAREEPRDDYLQFFPRNCEHPSKTDLFFWPDQVPELPQDRPPTAEEIADLALRDRA